MAEVSAEIRDALQACIRDIPVCTEMDFDLIEMSEGHCVITAPQPRQFDGLTGSYHGGLLATVADCIAWFAIATRLGPTTALTTTDLSIRYLAPCFGTVTAEATVIKFGRTLCPVQVDMYDAQRTQVASAQVTYFRMG